MIEDYVPPKGMIAKPSRDGTGVTVGTPKAIENEEHWLKMLKACLVTVKCDCKVWEVTLPIEKGEKCRLCGGALRMLDDDDTLQ